MCVCVDRALERERARGRGRGARGGEHDPGIEISEGRGARESLLGV